MLLRQTWYVSMVYVILFISLNDGINQQNHFINSVDLIIAAYSPFEFALVSVDNIATDKDQQHVTEVFGHTNRVVQILTANQTSEMLWVEQLDVVLARLSLDDELNIDMVVKLNERMGNKAKATPRLVLSVPPENELQDQYRLLQHIRSSIYSRIRLSVILEKEGTAELYAFRHNDLEFLCDTHSLDQCDGGPVRGSTVRVVHDNWEPMFYESEDGTGFVGLMYDLFDIIATRLDLKPVYVKNVEPGIWGTPPQENETWRGMMGMMFREEVDLSIAGFAASASRYDGVDFSHAVITFNVALFAKRSAGSKVNTQTYFHEFDKYIWLGILMTSAITIGMLLVILALTTRDLSCKSSFALAIVLRALVNKGTEMIERPSYSLKLAVIVLFSFTTILHVSYRGSLNSFLAVIIEPKGIQNLKDVLEQTNGITFWPSGLVESTFINAEESSVMGQLYKQFVADPNAPVYSYSDGLNNVHYSNYALLAEDETTAALPEFTCDIVWNKEYSMFKYANAIPFSVGSKFRDPVNHELLKLINQGIVERLRQIHIRNKQRSEADCQKSRVVELSYQHVFAPFAGLALAAACAAALTLFEIVLKMSSKVYIDTTGNKHHGDIKRNHIKDKATLKILQAKHILSLKHVNSIAQLETLIVILEK